MNDKLINLINQAASNNERLLDLLKNLPAADQAAYLPKVTAHITQLENTIKSIKDMAGIKTNLKNLAATAAKVNMEPVIRTDYMQDIMAKTYPGVAIEAILGGFEGSWERVIAKRLEWDAALKISEAVFLTEEELSRIENLVFSNARLERVRDIFLFSCYTGYAPVDACKLTSDNIVRDNFENAWLKTFRTKTNIKANVPILYVPDIG